jgi:hypothetical protein
MSARLPNSGEHDRLSRPSSDERPQPTAIERWLATSQADAERRGLPELGPLLHNLAQATRVLRAGIFNEDASGRTPRS